MKEICKAVVLANRSKKRDYLRMRLVQNLGDRKLNQMLSERLDQTA